MEFFGVRLPPHLAAKVKAAAARDGQTIAATIRRLLTQATQ